MADLLFHMQGILRWHLEILEYADEDRVTGMLSLANGEGSVVLRLEGALDERWMGEIGCDEIRIIDAGDSDDTQCEFGRYRLELLELSTRGETSPNGSFVLDSFETLLFLVSRVFLVRGRGTAVVPDRFRFTAEVRAGDQVVIRGGGRPPLTTTVWALPAHARPAHETTPDDASAALLLPGGIYPDVQVGREVWLASHRPVGSARRRR